MSLLVLGAFLSCIMALAAVAITSRHDSDGFSGA